MESKIMIDIDDSGRPFIYVDYKGSEDLRDKVISRFLSRCGAFNLMPVPGQLQDKPIELTLHVLWYDQENQRLQAMIEVPEIEKATQISAAQEALVNYPDSPQARQAFLNGFNWAYSDKPQK